MPAAQALSLWDRLWAAGREHGIRAIGYAALNRARIEAGFIVANADFVTAETALRADRARLPDEIGLDWLVDVEKPIFNGRHAILEARRNQTLKHMLVGLEIEGQYPAPKAPSSITARSTRPASSAPPSGRRLPSATSPSRAWTRPYGSRITDDLWVEIYACANCNTRR